MQPMLTLHVQIAVKAGHLEAFCRATQENVAASRQEPGVVRFEFLQVAEDPQRFVLWEVYRDPAAHAAHRETAHYQKWRDAVAPMMAEPRVGTKLLPVAAG